MKLSVLVISYNHAKLIKQAIESVLMQQVNFDYEIIIGDDFSTDGTREILRGYASRFPGKIHLHLQSKNMGAVKNLSSIYTLSKGQYIALLDGDDYWTNPLKLQRQVDFLEEHSESSGCFHRLKFQYDQKLPHQKYKHLPDHDNVKKSITQMDLLHGNVIGTTSIVFRKQALETLPKWYEENLNLLGDWPLFILIAAHGNIDFIDDVWGVYRVHSESNWFCASGMKRKEETIKVFHCLKNYLPRETHKEITVMIARMIRGIIQTSRSWHEAAEIIKRTRVINDYPNLVAKELFRFFLKRLRLRLVANRIEALALRRRS